MAKASEMVHIKYQDLDITYDERNDKWEVDDENTGITIRRSTLVDLKKGIDVALRSKGKGRFKRFSAWFAGTYGPDVWQIVTVTSIVEDNYHRIETYNNAWIVRDDKSREKVSLNLLYKDIKSNADRVKSLCDLDAEIAELEKKRKVIRDKLISVKVPTEPKND